MDRSEFEELRDLPDKVIQDDVIFRQPQDMKPNFTCGPLRIINSLKANLVLHCTYKPEIPSYTFNFTVVGTGPICRIDVNGTVHGRAGRTHKHSLTRASDATPNKNLPVAVSRPDLELKSAPELWRIVCDEARIVHTGRFFNPERDVP